MNDDLEESTDDARSADEASGAVPLDDVLPALAHPRRRQAVHCLQGRGEPTSLSTVAKAVAGREGGPETREVPDGELDPVRLALHHRHLPMLERAGIVEYDPDSHVVVLAENAAAVGPLLGAVGE